MKAKGKPSEGFINPKKYDSEKSKELLEKSQQVTRKSTTIQAQKTPKCLR